MTSDTYEITLDKFIYGGEAMGRLPDGRAVFVPYALPGERVRVRLTFQKRGFARAKLLEILEASPDRIEPKCKHFFVPLSHELGEAPGGRAHCRGCHYQHIPYEAQLHAKEEILRDQLTRIGKIENPPVKEIIPSPDEWNYRNQMDFQLGDDGKIASVGADLVSARVPARTDPITECCLPAPALGDFWHQLDFGANDLFQHISLRLDAADNLMLIIHSDDPETPEMTLEADLSVVHVTAGDAIVMGGDDHLIMEINARPFRVSATSFFRGNTAIVEKMISHLLETLPLTPDAALLELYSGIGTFSAFLASKVGRLVCVEESPATCDDFSVNLDEFENVEIYQASADAVLPSINFTPNILLVDPPPSGIGRRTLDGILSLAPSALTYVSSDPSTLARDAARLIKGGYRLDAITPFDLAPQTAQIDSIAIFIKSFHYRTLFIK